MFTIFVITSINISMELKLDYHMRQQKNHRFFLRIGVSMWSSIWGNLSHTKLYAYIFAIWWKLVVIYSETKLRTKNYNTDDSKHRKLTITNWELDMFNYKTWAVLLIEQETLQRQTTRKPDIDNIGKARKIEKHTRSRTTNFNKLGDTHRIIWIQTPMN